MLVLDGRFFACRVNAGRMAVQPDPFDATCRPQPIGGQHPKGSSPGLPLRPATGPLRRGRLRVGLHPGRPGNNSTIQEELED